MSWDVMGVVFVNKSVDFFPIGELALVLLVMDQVVEGCKAWC